MPGGSPCFLCSGDFCRVEVLAILQHFQMDVRFLGAFTADAAHFAQCLPGTDRLALLHRRAGHAAEPPDTARTRHRRPEASSSVTTLLHRPSVPVSVTLPEQGALTSLPSAQA